MTLLDRFAELLKLKDKINVNHIAITTDGIVKWAKANDKTVEESCKQGNLIIKNTIKIPTTNQELLYLTKSTKLASTTKKLDKIKETKNGTPNADWV